MSSAKFWARLALFSVPILAMAVLTTVLDLIGLFVTPIGIALRRPGTSVIHGDTISVPPHWLWLWGNDQDGYEPYWYSVYKPKWNKYWRMYVWAAIRNPTNNLRFVRWINPEIDPYGATYQTLLRNWGDISLCTVGPFARILLWRVGGSAFQIGWKISYPFEVERQIKLFGKAVPWGFGIRRKHV